MKISKPFFVVGLMFALAPIAVIGCSSGGGDSDDDGGSGGESTGGDGGDSAGGKGGSANGGKGGSASGGKGGSGNGGSGGTAAGGGGGSAAGGNSGGSGGGMNAAGAGGMNTAGAGGTSAGGSGGAPAVAAKFKTDIAPVLATKCGTTCHGGEYASRALARLKENTNGACGGGPRVVARSAATSPVIKNVKGTSEPCGMRRMPLVRPAGCNSNTCAVSCTGDACLTPDQIAKLESWINAGANDD